MANEKVSQLLDLFASDIQTNDIFLVTDMSLRQSKKLEVGQLLSFIESSGSFFANRASIADTASYVNALSIEGAVISSLNASESISSSFATKAVSSSFANSASWAAFAASTIISITTADSASHLNYVGLPNGTASYSMNSATSDLSATASALLYTGASNGTASFAVNASQSLQSFNSINAETASIAISSSYSTSSSFADSSSFSTSSSFSNTSSLSIISNLSFTSNTASYLDNTSQISSLIPFRTYAVANPMGSISTGSIQLIWQYNRHFGGTFLSSINSNTNVVTLISPGNNPGEDQMNVSMLTSDTSNKYVVAFSNGSAYYTLNLTTGAYIRVATFGISNVQYTPVKMVGDLTPTVYGVASDYTTNAANINMRNANNGSSIGSHLDLMSTPFANSGSFRSFERVNPSVLCFLHNPIKKRFYLLTTGTGYLHIFNFNTYSGDILAWWQAVNRMNYLTYEKTIILRGNDAYWSDTYAEHYSLEYDLVTGEEQAITAVRRGNTNLNGSVIRMAWKGS